MLKQTKFIWITDCRWSQRLCGGSASPRKFVEDSKRVGLCSLTHTPPSFQYLQHKKLRVSYYNAYYIKSSHPRLSQPLKRLTLSMRESGNRC